MTVAIQINNLTKRYPVSTGYADLLPESIRKREWINAVQDLSLIIEDGELFGLLGPNGAGKTTLIKILCTLVLPTSGQASCYGYDIIAEEQKIKEMVGYITAEERSFYWRLTGRQNLEFYAALYHIPSQKTRHRIDELLSLVGLSEHADRRFHVYSTGMRQKLAIARGLLNDPKLLFVDEPTKGLDVVSAQGMREFLAEKIAGTGRTVVLATHNMAEAQQLCSRLAIMNRGGIIAVGTVPELRTVFQKQDRCCLEVRNVSDALLTKLHHVTGVTWCSQPNQNNGITSLEMLLSNRKSVLPELIKLIVMDRGEICGCQVNETALEEILASALSNGGSGTV